MTKIFVRSVVLLLALALSPGPAASQATEPKAAVQEIAALSADMGHLDTIRRVAEELVFWQGVAIMGGEYGWTFKFGSDDTDNAWTYRLYNSLDEGSHEGARARQAIQRSRYLTDEEKEVGADLFRMYEEMHGIAGEIYELLLVDEVDAAAAIFDARTLSLRRDISRASSSIQIQLRDRIKRIALDVRLGK